MPSMVWSDNYSVNSPALDDQHKKLFLLVNDLQDAINHGKGRELVGQTIDQLVDYARIHFTDEENLLIKVKYPDLPEQQIQHDEFVYKVLEFKEEFNAGKVVMTTHVLEFVQGWLSNHIMKSDKKYSGYVKRFDLGL